MTDKTVISCLSTALPLFLLLILLSESVVVSGNIVDAGCTQELGEEAWRCASGIECISTDWLCDGFSQCGDDSDEGQSAGEGCNLFPDSQCLSYQGKEHFLCKVPGMPDKCLPSREEADQCEASGGASGACEEGKWRCFDGRCILERLVCDEYEHCEDGSDEGYEPLYGCNRFNNSCTSWGGDHFQRCPASPSVCINIPDFPNIANASACRDCLDATGSKVKDLWRCDNGKCINSTLRNNGKQDCEDGSDEDSTGIFDQWPALLLSAIFITLIGLGLSFFCRYINVWNPKTCFNCDLCSSSRRRHVSSSTKWYAALPKLPQGKAGHDATDMVVTREHEQDSEDQDDNSDIPIELIKYFDDKAKYWMHKKTTDQEKNSVFLSRLKGLTLDRPQISSPVIINDQFIGDAKRLYASLHNDPVRYHHLYMYLANRSSTVKQLNKVTNILLDWEKELHNLQLLEVLKCWRLHLGSSKLTAMIVNSVSDEPTFCSRLDNTCYPVRNFFRRIRRMCFQVKINQDYWLTKIVKTIYFLLYPFVQASLFYLEMIKQVLFVYILSTTLNHMSNNSPSSHPFELGMIVSMIIMIAIVHVLFAVYSFIFCEDIFEISHMKRCKSRVPYFFKLLAALMGLVGIMPVYVLANYVHYKVKQDMRIRHLQTHQFDDDESDEVPGTFVKMEQNRDAKLKERIVICREVCKLENKANLYGKVYNYYRVTSAVLGSVTLIVVLVLLLFVTGRPNRPIQLVDGVEQQLKNLFHSLISSDTTGANLTEELKLVKDLVFGISLLTSAFAVVTALVNYWYLAKNLALSWGGSTILGCYLSCLVVNRLTTYISIFAVTQSVEYDTGESEPSITLAPAAVIFCFLCLLQWLGVFLYKRYYSEGWKTGSGMDQWINVLINSMVVIPFMAHKDHIQILKQKEGLLTFSPLKKRDSLRKKVSIQRMDSEVENQFGGLQIANMEPSSSGVLLPDPSQLAVTFVYDDLRRLVQELWWKNPTGKLTVKDVRNHLATSQGNNLMMRSLNKNLDRTIEKTVMQLELTGLINVPLLNPIPTKREYFWLFVMVVLQNIMALIIEMVNGGVWTADGHYYSWDVRLATLLLGLVFLIMYYKKYHVLRDLTTNRVCGGWLHHLPVCLCCANDEQLSAPANEEAIEKMMSGQNTPMHQVPGAVVIRREIQTQTSFQGLYRPTLSTNDDGNLVPSAPLPDPDLDEVIVVKNIVESTPGCEDDGPGTFVKCISTNTSPYHEKPRDNNSNNTDQGCSFNNTKEGKVPQQPKQINKPSSLPVKPYKNSVKRPASDIELDDISSLDKRHAQSSNNNSNKSTLQSPDVKPQVRFSPQRKPSVVTAL